MALWGPSKVRQKPCDKMLQGIKGVLRTDVGNSPLWRRHPVKACLSLNLTVPWPPPLNSLTKLVSFLPTSPVLPPPTTTPTISPWSVRPGPRWSAAPQPPGRRGAARRARRPPRSASVPPADGRWRRPGPPPGLPWRRWAGCAAVSRLRDGTPRRPASELCGGGGGSQAGRSLGGWASHNSRRYSLCLKCFSLGMKVGRYVSMCVCMYVSTSHASHIQRGSYCSHGLQTQMQRIPQKYVSQGELSPF